MGTVQAQPVRIPVFPPVLVWGEACQSFLQLLDSMMDRPMKKYGIVFQDCCRQVRF